jgi:hypothetical protein
VLLIVAGIQAVKKFHPEQAISVPRAA